jgi:hypothetical protein
MPTTVSDDAQRAAKRAADRAAAEVRDRQIKAAREILQPRKVKLGQIPAWLNVRLRAYRRRRTWPDTRYSCDDSFSDTIRRIAEEATVKDMPWWLDHWGTCIENRYDCCAKAGVCFVSEPYHFCGDTAKLLDALAKALDLTWHVLPNSYWYPGHTQRIVLHQREKCPLGPTTHRELGLALHALNNQACRLACDVAGHLGKTRPVAKALFCVEKNLNAARSALDDALCAQSHRNFDSHVYYPGVETEPKRFDECCDLPAIADLLTRMQDQLADAMETALEMVPLTSRAGMALQRADGALYQAAELVGWIKDFPLPARRRTRVR